MTDPQSQNGNKQNYVRWLGFGIEFAGVIAIFCYIGYKLDETLHTSPWFLLTGFFVGFIGMFYLLLKEARNIRGK